MKTQFNVRRYWASWKTLGALCLVAGLADAHAQENRWRSTSGGKWEDGTKWSLGIPPNLNHSIMLINGGSRSPTFGTVLLDAASTAVPSAMAVSSLRVGNAGDTRFQDDVLTLSNAGPTTPLTVLGSALITNRGSVRIIGSVLTINDGLAVNGGGLTLNSGAVLNVRGNNYPAYDFTINGNLTMNGGSLNFSNFFASGMGIGSSGAGTMTLSGGTWRIDEAAFLDVGSAAGSVGSLIITGGLARLEGQKFSLAAQSNSTGSVLLNGGELITRDAQIGWRGVGRMTVSNGIWRANPQNAVIVGGTGGSDGALVLAGGTSVFSGRFNVGSPFEISTASFAITGGQMVITNHAVYIFGFAAISNGLWQAKDISVFRMGGPAARVAVAGGSTLISSSLQIGAQSCNQTGLVTVTGGNLTITNASTNATLGIYTGTFKLEGGIVIVDTIDLTSPCARFERSGGTLIYRTALLDPLRDDDGDGVPNAIEQSKGSDPLDPVDARRDSDGDGASDATELLSGTDPFNRNSVVKIISILRQGEDVRLRWKTAGGRTNIVQAAETITGSNTFSDLIQTVTPGSGDKTNTYIEPGGAIISPSRFYRIKVVP